MSGMLDDDESVSIKSRGRIAIVGEETKCREQQPRLAAGRRQLRRVTFVAAERGEDGEGGRAQGGGGARPVIRNRSLEEIANCVWAPERESR